MKRAAVTGSSFFVFLCSSRFIALTVKNIRSIIIIRTNVCNYQCYYQWRKGTGQIMVIQESMGLMEKLRILADGAKYDVACTSSGVDRSGSFDGMGNSIAAGICHSFSADG